MRLIQPVPFATAALVLALLPTGLYSQLKPHPVTLKTVLDKTINANLVMNGSPWQIKLASGVIVSIPESDFNSVTVIGASDAGEQAPLANIRIESNKSRRVYEGLWYNGSSLLLILPNTPGEPDLSLSAFPKHRVYGDAYAPTLEDKDGKLYLTIHVRDLKTIAFTPARAAPQKAK